MRQRDPRERALLAHVHRGDPGDYLTDKAARGQLHIFSGDRRDRPCGREAAIAVWRDRQAASPSGQAVLIARDNARRARLNTLARAELQHEGRLGESVPIAGQEFAVGDRVIARHNDRRREVDNGMRGTILAVDPNEKELSSAPTATPTGHSTPPTSPSTSSTPTPSPPTPSKAAPSTGPASSATPTTSPATGPTPPSPAHATPPSSSSSTPQPSTNSTAPRSPPTTPRSSPTSGRHSSAWRQTMRRRDDEDLALDRIDSIDSIASAARGDISPPAPQAATQNAGTTRRRGQSTQLRTELAQLRERIASPTQINSPTSSRPHATRGRRPRPRRRRGTRANRRTSSGQLAEVTARRSRDPAALAFERERLSAAEQHIATAAERERELAANTPDWTNPGGEHEALRERAAALEAKLAILRQQLLAQRA